MATTATAIKNYTDVQAMKKVKPGQDKTFWQAVMFKRTSDPIGWEHGIAKMNGCFGVSDVQFIIDSEGKKIPHREMHDFILTTGPMAHILLGNEH